MKNVMTEITVNLYLMRKYLNLLHLFKEIIVNDWHTQVAIMEYIATKKLIKC